MGFNSGFKGLIFSHLRLGLASGLLKTLSVAKVSSVFGNHSELDTSSYELSFSQWPILAPRTIVTFPPESPSIASEMKGIWVLSICGVTLRGERPRTRTKTSPNATLGTTYCSRRESGFDSRSNQCRICSGRSGNETDFCPCSLVFLCHYHPFHVPHASSMSTTDRRILLTTVTAVFGCPLSVSFQQWFTRL